MKTRSRFGFLTSVCCAVAISLTIASCNKGMHDHDVNKAPYYNLDATLSPTTAKDGYAGKEAGYIKFRQDPDTARIISLDTWVYDLQPNHSYILQRAVNPITDSSCSSTAWLSLGFGLVAQSIHTDAKGDGHELLFRAVTAIARGTEFRIHFQIIDSVTAMPVLASDCLQYTVR